MKILPRTLPILAAGVLFSLTTSADAHMPGEGDHGVRNPGHEGRDYGNRDPGWHDGDGRQDGALTRKEAHHLRHDRRRVHQARDFHRSHRGRH